MRNIDHLLTRVDENFSSEIKRIEDNFTESQLESIVINVINSKIRKYLADKINEILNQKMYLLIDDVIESYNSGEELEIIINHEIKKYLHSGGFSDNLQSAIEDYFDKKFADG